MGIITKTGVGVIAYDEHGNVRERGGEVVWQHLAPSVKAMIRERAGADPVRHVGRLSEYGQTTYRVVVGGKDGTRSFSIVAVNPIGRRAENRTLRTSTSE